MIWIDDLVWLEPAYLRRRFRPEDNGLSVGDLAAALSGASGGTRDYVLAHLPPVRADRIADAVASSTPAPPEIFEAQVKVMGVYFWEVVYRKHPDVYELFSRSQRFAFDELFPADRYRNAIVVDVGCGTGKLVAHLAEVARQVYGVDPAEPMLDMARTKFAGNPRVTFLTGTFADLPLADNSVDFVVSNMAFHTTEERGGVAGLRSMARVLRTGGEIRIVVANARCQDLLIAHGFAEAFVPGELGWEPPPEPRSLLLECLFDLSRNVGATDQTEWASLGKAPRHLFCPSAWRPEWTQRALIKLFEGAPIGSLFLGGDCCLPLGVPVYSWTKTEGNPWPMPRPTEPA
jgi:ubiquinone/menaquinone biosynthesis C-methylase UbiE